MIALPSDLCLVLLPVGAEKVRVMSNTIVITFVTQVVLTNIRGYRELPKMGF